MQFYYFQDGNTRKQPDEPMRNRRQRMHGGMHPGWACFLCALGSGFFGALAVIASIQWAMLRVSLGLVLFLIIVSMALFIIGGKKAERLR